MAGRHCPDRTVRRGADRIGHLYCAGRRTDLRGTGGAGLRARRTRGVGRQVAQARRQALRQRGHRLGKAGFPHAYHYPRGRPRSHQGQAVRACGHEPGPGKPWLCGRHSGLQSHEDVQLRKRHGRARAGARDERRGCRGLGPEAPSDGLYRRARFRRHADAIAGRGPDRGGAKGHAFRGPAPEPAAELATDADPRA